jgi:hypothetical protein
VDDRVEMSKFICRQNIGRYERLLRTHLTDLERGFIERRLAEEKHGLQSAEETLSRVAGNELKKVHPASKAIVAVFLSNPFEFLLSSFNLIEQVCLI